MDTEGIPIDKAELATQLRTRGLLHTVTDLKCHRREDNYSELLVALVAILNATDAPSIDLHLEEALTTLEGPRFFLVQRVLCDLIPLLDVNQDLLLSFITRLLDKGDDALSTAFGEWTTKDAARPFKVYCSGSMILDTNVGGKIATINEVSDDQKATFFFS
jgi:hypothetical protein